MKLDTRTCAFAFAFASIVFAGGCRTPINEENLGTLEPEKGGYFANAGGRILVERLAGGGLELRYNLWVQLGKPGQRLLKLEVTFENPEDKSQPLIVKQDLPAGETSVEMTSPPVWGVIPDHDYAVVIRAHDPAGKLLGTQRLRIRSLIDTRGLQRGGN